MSDRFSSDEEVLARLVREAGDPSVLPDPQYAETLRAAILDRLGPAETVAHMTEGILKADVIPTIILKRTQTMKRIAKFAVAATILVAFSILVSWIAIGGGSTNMAFARVAEALDSLNSATFDVTSTSTWKRGETRAGRPRRGTEKGSSLHRRASEWRCGSVLTIRRRTSRFPTTERPRPSCSCPWRSSPSPWTWRRCAGN